MTIKIKVSKVSYFINVAGYSVTQFLPVLIYGKGVYILVICSNIKKNKEFYC